MDNEALKQEALRELARRELERRQAANQQPPIEAAQPEGHLGHKIGAAIDGVAQGMTFGYSDEIAAGLDSGFGFLGDYDKSLEEERARMAENERLAGGYRVGGEIGGSLVGAGGLVKNGITLAGKTAGKSLMPRVAAGLTEGAAYGGLYGSGTAEEGERLKGATSGALFGGVVGGAVPVAGAALRGGVSAASKGIRNRVGGLVSPKAAAASQVKQAIATDRAIGSGLSKADEVAAKVNNQPIMNFDRGGETVRALARSAANQNPAARETASRAVSDRFGGQGQRAKTFIDRIMKGDVDDIAMRESIKQSAREANKPAYSKAYSFNYGDKFPDRLQQILPRIPASAMKNARAIAKANGHEMGEQLIASIDDVSDTVTFNRMPSLKEFDYIQRGLRSATNTAYRQGAGEVGTTYKALHRELLSEMDAINPYFQQARQGAARFFDAEDALEAGRKFVTQNRQNGEVAKVLQSMNKADKEAFAVGFAGELKKSISQAGDRRNVIQQIFGSDQSREKIKLALGEKRFKEFEAFVKVENVMDMARSSFGNSTTARQLVELGIAGSVGGATYLGTGDITQGLIAGAAVRGARFGQQKANERILKEVADILISNNSQKMRGLAAKAAVSQRHMRAVEHYMNILERGATMGAISQAN